MLVPSTSPLSSSSSSSFPQGEDTDFKSILATATHETFHALGFSSSNFPFFRNSDGTPRTPRDSAVPHQLAASNLLYVMWSEHGGHW